MLILLLLWVLIYFINLGFVAKKSGISFTSAFVYWIAQICGGILGSLIGLATVGSVNAPMMNF
jgi:hypothetical protein